MLREFRTSSPSVKLQFNCLANAEILVDALNSDIEDKLHVEHVVIGTAMANFSLDYVFKSISS
jgi:hypothetical protein